MAEDGGSQRPRIAVEKNGWWVGILGPISKALCLLDNRKIGTSGAKVPLRALVGSRGRSKGLCFCRDSKVRKRKIGRESMLRWESGGFIFHLDEFEGWMQLCKKNNYIAALLISFSSQCYIVDIQ